MKFQSGTYSVYDDLPVLATSLFGKPTPISSLLEEMALLKRLPIEHSYSALLARNAADDRATAHICGYDKQPEEGEPVFAL